MEQGKGPCHTLGEEDVHKNQSEGVGEGEEEDHWFLPVLELLEGALGEEVGTHSDPADERFEVESHQRGLSFLPIPPLLLRHLLLRRMHC